MLPITVLKAALLLYSHAHAMTSPPRKATQPQKPPSSISHIVRSIEGFRIDEPSKRATREVIISYLIGPDATAGILNITPREHHHIPSDVICNSCTSNTGKLNVAESTLDVKEFLNDLMVGTDGYTVSHWNLKKSSIVSCEYNTSRPNITKSSRLYAKGLTTTKCLSSVTQYKKSFAIYNFQDQRITCISPVEKPGYSRKDVIYEEEIKDFSQCHIHDGWLWDLNDKNQFYRYDITKRGSTTYDIPNLAKHHEISRLIRNICATSEDGSTCASYFSKQKPLQKLRHCIVIWNGHNAQIKQTIDLEAYHSAPKHTVLSKNGSRLTCEINSRYVTEICIATLHPTIAFQYYRVDTPLRWSMTSEDGIILVACGTNQIHVINPHLHSRIAMGMNTCWKSLPLCALNQTAQSMVWSYKAIVKGGTINIFKFVTLDNLDLRKYKLKHIEFSYNLLRAIRIACEDEQMLQSQRKHEKVLVDLHESVSAYHDFIALPTELAQFFLATYGVPHGPLRVQGQSSSFRPAQAWEKILH